MIGQKINKPVENRTEYAQAALWCNHNTARIEDRGDYYEIVAVPPVPEPTLEEARAEKQAELNDAFERASNKAHCLSSLGFEIDADETASRNVMNLIIAMETTGEETVPFRGCDNRFHEVTLAQLKTVQQEIIAHARARYDRKWTLREAIDSAASVEALDAVQIVFPEANP